MVGTLSAVIPNRVVRRRAPFYVPWLLAIAPVVSFPLELYAIAGAVSIAPAVDPTPLLIALVSLLVRRWNGVRSVLFDACAISAGIVAVEYALLVYLTFTGELPSAQLQWAGYLFMLYLAQMAALLFLFSVACVLSLVSLWRLRGQRSSLSDA